MSDRLTYVYCLVQSRTRPNLDDAPRGMPGAKNVRALRVESGDASPRSRSASLWLIVSSVPARAYSERSLAAGLQDLDWVGRHAMAHEAVVEHFLSAAAVLPMQLFTLFTSDERALGHASRNLRRIDRMLSRVERQLEWGLRVTFDETLAERPGGQAAVAGGTQRSRSPARDLGNGGAGTSYLLRKRDLIERRQARLALAKTEAGRLYRAMAREASRARRHTATEAAGRGSPLLLDAAFLVPVRRSSSFRAALRRNTAAPNTSGLVVSLTGPWPPYNFIDTVGGRKAPRR